MRRKDIWLRRALRASWLFILLLFLFLGFIRSYINAPSTGNKGATNQQNTTPNQNQSAPGKQVSDSADKSTVQTKDEVRVYADNEDDFKLWSRSEAIKFGFDKVANTISYLFVAASVLLGMIGKFMIDPLLEQNKGRPLPSETVVILLRHAAIGCIISICFGFFGYLYFTTLPTAEEFTIFTQLGFAVFCQLVSFILAAFLLMGAINFIVNQHLKVKR